MLRNKKISWIGIGDGESVAYQLLFGKINLRINKRIRIGKCDGIKKYDLINRLRAFFLIEIAVIPTTPDFFWQKSAKKCRNRGYTHHPFAEIAVIPTTLLPKSRLYPPPQGQKE